MLSDSGICNNGPPLCTVNTFQPAVGAGVAQLSISSDDAAPPASKDMRDPEAALSRIRRAQMVEAFIDSVEYRNRFGP
jgi:hypothetical protein